MKCSNDEKDKRRIVHVTHPSLNNHVFNQFQGDKAYPYRCKKHDNLSLSSFGASVTVSSWMAVPSSLLDDHYYETTHCYAKHPVQLRYKAKWIPRGTPFCALRHGPKTRASAFCLITHAQKVAVTDPQDWVPVRYWVRQDKSACAMRHYNAHARYY